MTLIGSCNGLRGKDEQKMREIKFRGKRVEDNRWVFGYYVLTHDSHRIIYEDYEGFYCEEEVIPESVGQYTGIKDKKHREIYEGDIVEQELLGNVSLDFGSFIGVVKFIDGTYMIENAEGTFGVELFSETNPNEAIGNIYENPELLEEK